MPILLESIFFLIVLSLEDVRKDFYVIRMHSFMIYLYSINFIDQKFLKVTTYYMYINYIFFSIDLDKTYLLFLPFPMYIH